MILLYGIGEVVDVSSKMKILWCNSNLFANSEKSCSLFRALEACLRTFKFKLNFLNHAFDHWCAQYIIWISSSARRGATTARYRLEVGTSKLRERGKHEQ